MFPIFSATWKQQNHTDHSGTNRKKQSAHLCTVYFRPTPPMENFERYAIRTVELTMVLWEATAWRAVAARDPMKRKHGPIISINMSPRKSKTPWSLTYRYVYNLYIIFFPWLKEVGGNYILFLFWVITRCHFRKAPLSAALMPKSCKRFEANSKDLEPWIDEWKLPLNTGVPVMDWNEQSHFDEDTQFWTYKYINKNIDLYKHNI